ncbi:MAG TPA: hemolysin family protein [Myxococcaceae bacterium]|nr:hemolysin family protein [Myxococcaceae bacterium]
MNLGTILLALALVLANGFFVATEFAMVKIRPTRVRALLAEGKPGAENVLRLLQRMDVYLSATQFGITLASLGLGWIAEPAFAPFLEPVVRLFFPAGDVRGLIKTLTLALVFVLITFLHIVIGELGAKSLALQKTESTALACAWPIRVFYYLFFPAIWLLNTLARQVLRLFGLKVASSAAEAHSEEELRVILASSAASGAIALPQAELLERALGMLEKTARQVLVPRNQIRYLDLEETLEKNIADARASGHTWVPVCRGNLDRVDGVVNVKDVFVLLSRGELKSIAQVQRPVLFVPENVSLEQLLSEFRRRRAQLAIVVDEHGGTTGMVTIADVVAELVGDVAELGRRMEEVKTLPGGRWELPGTAELDDLADKLGMHFDVKNGEVTTIAGFLMAKLGRIPDLGDRWPLGDYDVVVESTDGPRVLKVRIEPRAQTLPERPRPNQRAGEA